MSQVRCRLYTSPPGVEARCSDLDYQSKSVYYSMEGVRRLSYQHEASNVQLRYLSSLRGSDLGRSTALAISVFCIRDNLPKPLLR